jgi:dCTP deaminase
MLLNDGDILHALKDQSLSIEPFDLSQIQPSSVDLHLGNEFAIVNDNDGKTMYLKHDNSERLIRMSVPAGDYFVLQPEHFVLATTVERVRLGNTLAARVEGKSSLGRLGLVVHSTAGFIDPGFEGQVTLELANLLQVPIALYPGMPVCQLAIFMLSSAALTPYRGKYQHQTGPQGSQYHRNFEPAMKREFKTLLREVVDGSE